MISIEINGLEEFRSELLGFSDPFRESVINSMSQIAFDSAYRSIGPHTKTGALAQSLDNQPITGGRRVFNDPYRAPHALFIHQGTRDHPVFPTKKKALRWVGSDGLFWFSKGHQVRGIREDPYMNRAADDALTQLNRLVDQSLSESWRGA